MRESQHDQSGKSSGFLRTWKHAAAAVHAVACHSCGELYYFLGLPLLRAIFFLLSSTYRVQKTIGRDVADRSVADPKSVYAPCYWHQHHVLCSAMIRDWIRRGFKACFLISASVDGEVPDRVARAWGAEVIRGSANQTGALVLRDMQQMMKRGVSIVTTADGPNGPKYEFKPGTVLMARIGGAPMVPLACAADRAWYLNRWDDFMIPKPFARVVLAVGEPLKFREVHQWNKCRNIDCKCNMQPTP